jgi:hypothetical protein
MVRPAVLGGICLAAVVTATGAAQQTSPSAADLVRGILESDPWGLGDAEVTASVRIRDQSGRVRELAFTAQSRRYDGHLTKSLVRFTSPSDLAGVGFLQIQNENKDDDRWLYLPELGRSRRVSGATRQGAFMGTDFSFADLDRRDLRHSSAKITGEEPIDGTPCWKLDATPTGGDSPYGRLEIWINRANGVPLQWRMYARSGVLLKTLVARQTRQIEGRWFIVASVMTNHAERRETELTLDRIVPTSQIPDHIFTLRNLEKS